MMRSAMRRVLNPYAITSFNQSPMIPAGLRGFATISPPKEGMYSKPSNVSRWSEQEKFHNHEKEGLSRHEINEQLAAGADTSPSAPINSRRLFGDVKPMGDDPKIRQYRRGGLMVFVGFLVIIHPWFSLNWLKIYRAQKIKGEEGDYTAYFGQEKKTTAMIQDEVAGRHKTMTKFRVLKGLHTEGKAEHHQRPGGPQQGRQNEGMGKFT